MGKKRNTVDLNKLNESDLKALEYLGRLLSYFTDDYSELAKRLTVAFGSPAAVFIAPKEELLNIEGITEKGAEFISDFRNLCSDYFSVLQGKRVRVFNSETAYNYLKDKFMGLKNECIALMILNSQGYIVYNEIICEGSVNIVPVYIREIIRLCIEYDTDTVIIAHNHVSGSPIPSNNDVKSTREIQFALEGIYVSLYDHIIIADNDYFSMRSSGWLKDITSNADNFRRCVIEDE